jgi:hypothetical protein
MRLLPAACIGTMLLALMAGCNGAGPAEGADGGPGDGSPEPPATQRDVLAWRFGACGDGGPPAPSHVLVRMEAGLAWLSVEGNVSWVHRGPTLGAAMVGPDLVVAEPAADGNVTLRESGAAQPFATLPRLDAMAVAGDVLWATTGATLHAYRDGAGIGKLELSAPGFPRGKAVHAVLVVDDVAYLLDNVALPVWRFRADVGDPANPLQVSAVRDIVVNSHLAHQWVDGGAWHIVVDTGSRQGGSQAVWVDREGNVSRLTTYDHPYGGTPEGHAILAVAAQGADGPVSAVVDRDGTPVLGQVALEDGREMVVYCPRTWGVPLATGADATASAFTGRGFVAAAYREHVLAAPTFGGVQNGFTAPGAVLAVLDARFRP